MEFLDFRTAKCKDCFKCLRECPVKAIRYENHQAKIIDERCILCGRCTVVCPQNAKTVHSETDKVESLLSGTERVVASVAPSFVASFGLSSFSQMEKALKKLGFDVVEETAIGAKAVTEEYAKLLKTGNYKNFITSACPAINKMIQIYYPEALKYLAPVASPMVAHARILKEKFPDAKIIFIGPCIAKKREGKESGIIDAVLTFEELENIFTARGIDPKKEIPEEGNEGGERNIAKYYPINSGIIKSFTELPEGYEYVAVDGVNRSFEVLDDISHYSGLFIEINCCEYACVNGPCALKTDGGAIKANESVRKYVKSGKGDEAAAYNLSDISEKHPFIGLPTGMPCERDIKAVLAKTGKTKPEDELNCGACGYATCRDKAIAVLRGYADLEMCLPFMRTRAESMSYEIIQNSPYGIIVLDNDLKIIEYNSSARTLLGIEEKDAKGEYAYDCFDANEFVIAQNSKNNVIKKKIRFDKSGKYADATIVRVENQKIMFGIFKDITDSVEYGKKLDEMKRETLETTDEVIKKQMRVAQEIASLLGETTAETKVALLKLKKTLHPSDETGD